MNCPLGLIKYSEPESKTLQGLLATDSSKSLKKKPLHPLGGIDQLTEKYITGYAQASFFSLNQQDISSSWTDSQLKAPFSHFGTFRKRLKK